MAFDPYRGTDGLQAAWARFVYWLTTELPEQWNQLNALLQSLGGSAPTGGAGSTIDSSLGTVDPLAAWRIEALSASDQAAARSLAGNWTTLWNITHAPQVLGVWVNWGGAPSPPIAAALSLGWRIWHLGNGNVETAPADYGYPASAGAIEWIIGTPGGAI